MLNRIVLKRSGRQEGESPFWISFSDLMTALMALFLLVMAVTLVSVTKEVSEEGKEKTAKLNAERQRAAEIRSLMATIVEGSREFPSVNVNENTNRINLGTFVQFRVKDFDIQPSGARFLRLYVPRLLKIQDTELGRKWIRQFVVEGFTDQDGTYLYNLGLSLQRSRAVVCSLYAPPFADERPLSEREKQQVRDLFLVGGYSFNSIKDSKDASRRVELKIDFRALDEIPEAKPDQTGTEFGQC